MRPPASLFLDDKKNNSTVVSSSTKSAKIAGLHLVVSSGIIKETDSRSVKGGCVDKYDFNSRGGCRRTKTSPGDSQKDVAQRGDAREQVRGRMAHRPRRARRVEEATQKSIWETGSGQLINEPISSVASRTRLLIGTHQAESAGYYLIVHYNALSPVWQRYRALQGAVMGGEVVERDLNPMAITSITSTSRQSGEAERNVTLYFDNGARALTLPSAMLCQLQEREQQGQLFYEQIVLDMYESIPQIRLSQQKYKHACLCGEEPAVYGVFGEKCMKENLAEEHFAREWYAGSDVWQVAKAAYKAAQQAEQEGVSNAAD